MLGSRFFKHHVLHPRPKRLHQAFGGPGLRLGDADRDGEFEGHFRAHGPAGGGVEGGGGLARAGAHLDGYAGEEVSGGAGRGVCGLDVRLALDGGDEGVALALDALEH